MKQKTLKLWAFRKQSDNTYQWVVDRDVTEETSLQWLEVYKKDEPNVLFLVSNRKPSK